MKSCYLGRLGIRYVLTPYGLRKKRIGKDQLVSYREISEYSQQWPILLYHRHAIIMGERKLVKIVCMNNTALLKFLTKLEEESHAKIDMEDMVTAVALKRRKKSLRIKEEYKNRKRYFKSISNKEEPASGCTCHE